MSALLYFLKAEISAVDRPGETAFAFAFSEQVRRCGGQLWAENIQVPAVAGENGTLRMRAHRLPDRKFRGFAYRMAAPPWFERGQVADGNIRRLADVAIRDLTPFEIGRRLATTPLGRLCRHPEVRRALAQDRLARTIAPYLAVPDLLIHEDRLRRQWEAERPEAAAQAQEAIASWERSLTGLSPESLRLRSRVRFAALRRIDATAVGREIFEPCPAYFGEPYLRGHVPTPDLPVRSQDVTPFKTGIVSEAQYWPKPETEMRSRLSRCDPAIVRALETALFPLLGLSGSDDGFAAAVAIWLAVAPLRKFERGSPLPLFPFRTAFPEGIVPPGFRLRIAPSVVREAGGGPGTLAALGLSPYVAEPFGDFAEKHRDLLSDWMGTTTALAVGKWAAHEDEGKWNGLFCGKTAAQKANRARPI